MKYKPGDKVRIVKQWGKNSYQNGAGKMDHWLGKVMTVYECDTRRMEGYYHMREDAGEYYHGPLHGWNWYENMIEGYASLEDVRADTEIEVNELL